MVQTLERSGSTFAEEAGRSSLVRLELSGFPSPRLPRSPRGFRWRRGLFRWRQFAAPEDRGSYRHHSPVRAASPIIVTPTHRAHPRTLKQRIFGLSLGYEDLNDHDQLRNDPLLARRGQERSPGQDRLRTRQRQGPGRQEHSQSPGTHPRGRRCRQPLQEDLCGTRCRRALRRASFVPTPCRRAIVLDLDATELPLHGHQLGRFFHGYYEGIVICPCTSSAAIIRSALLRPSDLDEPVGLEATPTHHRPDPPALAEGENPRSW